MGRAKHMRGCSVSRDSAAVYRRERPPSEPASSRSTKLPARVARRQELIARGASRLALGRALPKICSPVLLHTSRHHITLLKALISGRRHPRRLVPPAHVTVYSTQHACGELSLPVLHSHSFSEEADSPLARHCHQEAAAVKGLMAVMSVVAVSELSPDSGLHWQQYHVFCCGAGEACGAAADPATPS